MATRAADTQEFRKTKEKAERNLLWIGMFSIIMLFGGLTSAYIVRKDGGVWFSINLPAAFWISTAVIIASSVTMILAVWAFGSDKKGAGNIFLGLTTFLGLAFAWFQWMGYKELVGNGIYLSTSDGQDALISGSFIYVLSGLHLLHLAGGLIALLITQVKGLLGKYHSGNTHGVRLASIYWHFLDALWVYLFLFLTIFK